MERQFEKEDISYYSPLIDWASVLSFHFEAKRLHSLSARDKKYPITPDSNLSSSSSASAINFLGLGGRLLIGLTYDHVEVN